VAAALRAKELSTFQFEPYKDRLPDR